MPRRDSIPVDRRTVRAIVCAASPSMSTSSYSQTPSWATVRPPAVTNRWAGAVGSPYSSGRPSAVRPAGDDGEGALGVGVTGRLGEREVHAQTVVSARIDEGRRDPHHGFVRPQLHVGVDVDPVLAHPRL